jgi:hypothetical protein
MGKLILVGQPKHNEDIFFTNASKNFKGVQVFDSLGGKTDPDQDFYKYARLIESNNFNPQKKRYDKRKNAKVIGTGLPPTRF